MKMTKEMYEEIIIDDLAAKREREREREGALIVIKESKPTPSKKGCQFAPIVEVSLSTVCILSNQA